MIYNFDSNIEEVNVILWTVSKHLGRFQRNYREASLYMKNEDQKTRFMQNNLKYLQDSVASDLRNYYPDFTGQIRANQKYWTINSEEHLQFGCMYLIISLFKDKTEIVNVLFDLLSSIVYYCSIDKGAYKWQDGKLSEIKINPISHAIAVYKPNALSPPKKAIHIRHINNLQDYKNIKKCIISTAKYFVIVQLLNGSVAHGLLESKEYPELFIKEIGGIASIVQ